MGIYENSRIKFASSYKIFKSLCFDGFYLIVSMLMLIIHGDLTKIAREPLLFYYAYVVSAMDDWNIVPSCLFKII